MKHDRFFASFKITVLLLALLAGQAAWAETNVTLSEDPDIPEGTAGHWYVNMSKDSDLWLTLSADDLAAGKGTFKVYDDGGKSGNYSPNSESVLYIVAPTGYLIQVSGTVWTKSETPDEYLTLDNSRYPNYIFHDFWVRSTTDGEPFTFGPFVTHIDDKNETDGQYLTLGFYANDSPTTYQGLDLTVTVFENTLYHVNIADGITHGTVSVSPTSAYFTNVITLSLTPEENYYIGTVSYNDGSSDHVITPYNNGAYKFKMPQHDVTVSATFLDNVGHLWGEGNDGSAAKPYVIRNKGGWDLLAERSKTDNYTNKYFEFAADISDVTTAIATASDYPFCGHIDGKGHKVTLAMETIKTPAMIIWGGAGCSVENLTVDGTITMTEGMYGAGFISQAKGAVTLTNCRSSVTINYTPNYSTPHNGGFIGNLESGASATLTRCLFDGAFISSTAATFGGMVGSSGSIAIQNSVVVTAGATSLTANVNNDNYAFSSQNNTTNWSNDYYVYDTGTNHLNGTINRYTGNGQPLAWQVTLNDGATASHSGTGIAIGNGAATLYADGFSYGGNEYYTQGSSVTLGSTPDDGMTSVGYTATGVTVTGGGSFSMPNNAVAVTAHYARTDYINHWQASLTRDGSSEAKAYLITTTDGLNLLSSEVSGGNSFAGKFFKLDADITYNYTTVWNDTGSTENNFKAIGTNKSGLWFYGSFDGDGKTVSGIRIYGRGENHGLFGIVGGTVKNVILADTRITGPSDVGGIAGHSSGTVSNCHICGDVTIHAAYNTDSHGGIVGDNNGTVTGCTSAALITGAGDLSNYSRFGGIVGSNDGTVQNCIAAGAIVAAVTAAGAIVGSSSSGTTLSGNKYHSCLVGTNAFNIGVGFYYTDSTTGEHGDRTGATIDRTQLFLFDDRDNSALIAAYQSPSYHTAFNGATPDVSKLSVTLQGHTLYKDGRWNTLCLPFGVSGFSGTPLEGGSVYEMSAAGTSLDPSTGALTLVLSKVTSIDAGKPYIVKWASGSDVVNPVFSGAGISNAAPTEVSSSDGHAKFVGQYAPFEINDGNKNTILFIDAGNKIGYSSASRTLPAFGARFWVKTDGTSPGASAVTVDFGDGTGIRHLVGHLSDGVYWATYYNHDVRFTLPAGAQAYTMGTDHKLYRIGTDGRTIRENTAVVILSDTADIELTSSEDASPIAIHGPDSKNILHGGPVTVTNGKVPVPGSDPATTGTPYVLGVAGNPATIGFYQFTGDAIPANKAYYVE